MDTLTHRPVALAVAGLFSFLCLSVYQLLQKTHGVSCNIGIAYTVLSYSVSKVLHNCFQIVNFGDIRDIGVLWRHSRFLICYTKENKFPKSTQQQEKRTSEGKQSQKATSGVRRFTP